MSEPGRIPVGVVVERRKSASQWIDYVWQPVSVLPGRPEAEPWTVLSQEADRTIFYAGTTTIELYPTDTANYRDNLASGTPSVWVALRPIEANPPYKLFAVTVDPALRMMLSRVDPSRKPRIPALGALPESAEGVPVPQ